MFITAKTFQNQRVDDSLEQIQALCHEERPGLNSLIGNNHRTFPRQSRRNMVWNKLVCAAGVTQEGDSVLNLCLSLCLYSLHQSEFDVQNKPRPIQAESTERIKKGMNRASVLEAKYFPPCAVHKLFS